MLILFIARGRAGVIYISSPIVLRTGITLWLPPMASILPIDSRDHGNPVFMLPSEHLEALASRSTERGRNIRPTINGRTSPENPSEGMQYGAEFALRQVGILENQGLGSQL